MMRYVPACRASSSSSSSSLSSSSRRGRGRVVNANVNTTIVTSAVRRESARHHQLDDEEWLMEERGSVTTTSTVVAALAAACVAGASAIGYPGNALAEGFGSSTSGVLYNPKRGVELENLLQLDEKARNRKASVLTRGNIDVLLQELNALNAVDEQELEQVDAELALLAAKNVEGQLSDFTQSEEYEKLSDQKKRLVDKRANEASLQRRLKERKVIFGQLGAQGPVIVYGAALVASVVSNAIMHPLDTVKVRKISLKQNKSLETTMSMDDGSTDEELARVTREYEPTWDEIVGEGGVLSLYSGLSANLMKEGIPLGLYLGLYENAKDFLLQVDLMKPHPIIVYLIAGGFGEFFASILRLPAEAVKNGTQIGMTVPEAIQTNVLPAAARRNLFKCWKTALARDIPFGGIQLAIFEGLKLLIITLSITSLDPDAPVTEALFGAVGGMAGAFSTTPVDVVVTRMINERKALVDAGMPVDADGTSPIDTAKAVLAEQGVGGFFVGAKERVIYWGPAISIFLTVYCRIRQSYLPDIS